LSVSMLTVSVLPEERTRPQEVEEVAKPARLQTGKILRRKKDGDGRIHAVALFVPQHHSQAFGYGGARDNGPGRRRGRGLGSSRCVVCRRRRGHDGERHSALHARQFLAPEHIESLDAESVLDVGQVPGKGGPGDQRDPGTHRFVFDIRAEQAGVATVCGAAKQDAAAVDVGQVESEVLCAVSAWTTRHGGQPTSQLRVGAVRSIAGIHVVTRGVAHVETTDEFVERVLSQHLQLLVRPGEPLHVRIHTNKHLHRLGRVREGREMGLNRLPELGSRSRSAVLAALHEVVFELDSLAAAQFRVGRGITGMQSPSIRTKAKACPACRVSPAHPIWETDGYLFTLQPLHLLFAFVDFLPNNSEHKLLLVKGHFGFRELGRQLVIAGEQALKGIRRCRR
jgi:hypothetical protein